MTERNTTSRKREWGRGGRLDFHNNGLRVNTLGARCSGHQGAEPLATAFDTPGEPTACASAPLQGLDNTNIIFSSCLDPPLQADVSRWPL